MKKSLFAAAALTAIAGAAQAQSSVTVYGILDMGYIGSNAREVAASGVVTKTQKSAFGNGAEQTSRLGFKGTEDLGGGTSAFFTVELGLTPQNAELSGGVSKDALQGTNQASGSAVDNRQSFVGLKKNGLGQFAFGRQYTSVFNAAAATDPGQLNNVVGNVVYNSGSAYTADNNASGTNNNIGFTNRASNMLSVKSDSFSGLSGSAFYALNNTNATQTATGNTTGGAGNSNWNGWGLSADFTWQKLYLTAAYQSFKTQLTNGVYAASGTTLNANSVGPVSGQLSSNGAVFAPAQTSDKQTYVAGTYDFGILKAYLQWNGRKIQNDTASSVIIGNAATATSTVSGQQLNRTAQQIGVRSYITPTIEAWGSIGNGKYTGPIATAGLPASVNFVGWQLGSNYYLSKRTNLYAIYGQQQTSSVTGGTNGSGATANQYALGVRHTF
jgi:predicted porin